MFAQTLVCAMLQLRVCKEGVEGSARGYAGRKEFAPSIGGRRVVVREKSRRVFTRPFFAAIKNKVQYLRYGLDNTLQPDYFIST